MTRRVVFATLLPKSRDICIRHAERRHRTPSLNEVSRVGRPPTLSEFEKSRIVRKNRFSRGCAGTSGAGFAFPCDLRGYGHRTVPVSELAWPPARRRVGGRVADDLREVGHPLTTLDPEERTAGPR